MFLSVLGFNYNIWFLSLGRGYITESFRGYFKSNLRFIFTKTLYNLIFKHFKYKTVKTNFGGIPAPISFLMSALVFTSQDDCDSTIYMYSKIRVQKIICIFNMYVTKDGKEIFVWKSECLVLVIWLLYISVNYCRCKSQFQTGQTQTWKCSLIIRFWNKRFGANIVYQLFISIGHIFSCFRTKWKFDHFGSLNEFSRLSH